MYRERIHRTKGQNVAITMGMFLGVFWLLTKLLPRFIIWILILSGIGYILIHPSITSSEVPPASYDEGQKIIIEDQTKNPQLYNPNVVPKRWEDLEPTVPPQIQPNNRKHYGEYHQNQTEQS